MVCSLAAKIETIRSEGRPPLRRDLSRIAYNGSMFSTNHSIDVRLAYMKFCKSCVKDENLLLVELDT